MKIFKYPLQIQDDLVIRMPKDAKPLHVAMQVDSPFLWAAVNPDAPIMDRLFHVKGTGHTFSDALLGSYIGTFHMLNDSLIWHVFDGGEFV